MSAPFSCYEIALCQLSSGEVVKHITIRAVPLSILTTPGVYRQTFVKERGLRLFQARQDLRDLWRGWLLHAEYSASRGKTAADVVILSCC